MLFVLTFVIPITEIMINTDLKFRAEYYIATKILKFTDIIGSPAGANYDTLLSGYSEDHEQILGLFKAQSPAGVFYGGTAYNNNDFTTPDTQGLTNDWVQDSIALPTSGSDILCGTYTFSYKILIALFGTLTNYATGGFNITGNDYSLLFGTTPVGMKIKIFSAGGVTGHEGVYDITAMSFGTGTTKVFAAGVTPFTASADDRVAIIMETSKSFTFCYEQPATDIDSESSCIFSTATFTDDSTYDVLFTGYGTITPSVSRAWSVQCPSAYSVSPVTAGNVNPLTIGYGTSYNSGANIWTGSYIPQLTSTLTYSVDTWGTGVYWIIVHDSIISQSTLTVECDTCFCDIKQCVINLYEKYRGYLNSNPSKALTLAGYLLRINSAWTLYGMEERCGGDFTVWCNEISAIVASENCQCATDTTISKEVIPLSLQISGSSACDCGITFGSGSAGFPLSPAEGDTHIFNADGAYSKGDIYYYTSGAWVFQFNIIGATGATGANGSDGAAGADGVDGVAVVFDNTLEVPTTLTGAVYADFTGMVTGALSRLASLGDKYIIKATFGCTPITTVGGYVKLVIDGVTMKYTYLPSPINAIDIEHLFTGKIKELHIVAEATVVDVARKKLMVKYDVNAVDSHANILCSGTLYSLITLSSALNSVVISAQGKITSGSAVTCKRLSVEFLKK